MKIPVIPNSSFREIKRETGVVAGSQGEVKGIRKSFNDLACLWG